MIARWLTALGITRDSALFFWGKLTGAILFLASIGAEHASQQFGIPPGWMHAIQIAAAWLVFFSAQQSTSRLPGDPSK